MKAAVITKYGSAEGLQVQDVPIPELKSGEILVKIKASSVNPVDWKLRNGQFRYFIRLKFPAILGGDISGVVEKLGPDVTQFSVGDPIYGLISPIKGGAYAEYGTIPAIAASRKPENLTYEQAAAVPLAALTALQSLRDRAHLQKGQSVLILGASGGVGSFAVQIAKAYGAKVYGVCSKKNVALVKKLGADQIYNYDDTDFLKSGVKFDVVFDCVGASSFLKCRKVLKDTGVFVTTLPGTFFIALNLATKYLPGPRAKYILTQPKAADFSEITNLIESGKVVPLIDREYLLSQIAEAHRYSETGKARGKIVVKI